MAQISSILRTIQDLSRRIRSLEVINQSATLQFGDIVLDTVENRILVADRILIDGDGNFKISQTGENVLTEAENDLAFVFNPTTNDLKIKGDPINTAAEYFSHLSNEHYWTDSASYTDMTGCKFSVDGDNFNNQNVYFECVMANEQAGRTAYIRIYNITTGAELSGSEITTSVYPLTALTRVRSSALTFPSGSKEYKLQIRMSVTGAGGDNAHFYSARLVHTQL